MPIIEYPLQTAGASQIRAAEYVRMSTDHQQYSTHNQRAKIREYANERNIDIVRSYEDDGKSGLTIQGRFALQQLIKDVESKTCGFQVILVYDISRWGRFQDSDEAAHYEYLCKRASVKIIYCAEQFENDGTPVAAIVKGVKRAMAGEYSRELSVKVLAGQYRFVRMGYRQGGGSRVYGYRSLLVDIEGNVKGELGPGERKCVQSYHVVLALGKDEEAATVQRIFEWFVSSQLSEGEIANRLNKEGILKAGKKWNWNNIHYLLANEVYVGNNVFNKVSARLGMAKRFNSPGDWIRKENSHPSLVTLQTFMGAQQRICSRVRATQTDTELLQILQRVLAKHKKLTTRIIDAEPKCPSSSTYVHRFGSLIEAYRQIGYLPERECLFTKINRMIALRFPDISAQATYEFLGDKNSRDGIEGYSLAMARGYVKRVEEMLSAGRLF